MVCAVIVGNSDRSCIRSVDLIRHGSSLCGKRSHGLTTAFQDSDTSPTNQVRKVRQTHN